MRIELSTFGGEGAHTGSYVELTPEQISAIVQKAHAVSRLHRSGQSLDNALIDLDGALVAANMMEANPERVPPAQSASVTPGLIEAFSVLRKSATNEGCVDGQVTVLKQALDNVGTALRSAMASSATAEWKWIRIPSGRATEVRSLDMEELMTMVAKAASMGGAPTIKEAMEKHPLLLFQAFETLCEQKIAEREGSTTVLHVQSDGGDVSLTAPFGMKEADIRTAVETAVMGAGTIGDIEERLIAAGFERIEEVIVAVADVIADDESPAPGR